MAERDLEYEELEYEEYETEENARFFELREEAEDFEDRPRINWGSVAVVVLSIILAIFLSITGIRSLSQASEDAPYAGKSWVISGTYSDMSASLETKEYVAVYKGTLPQDDRMNGATFKSNVKDKKQVTAGEQVEFLGTEVGEIPADFEKEADALLVKNGDTLEVVRTGKKGSVNLVTDGSVAGAYTVGWGSVLGAVLVLIFGIGGAIWWHRRNAPVYDEDAYEDEPYEEYEDEELDEEEEQA